MNEQKVDPYQELKDSRADMAAFFESKGWALLYKWAEAQAAAEFEKAIRADNATEREEARLSGLGIERVMRLPFFMAEHAGLNTDKEAPSHSD